MSSATSTEVIPVFLNPRPLARSAGRFILLPLLPYRPSLKPLPLEIWSKILSYVFDHYEADTSKPRWAREELRQGLLAVCKELQVRRTLICSRRQVLYKYLYNTCYGTHCVFELLLIACPCHAFRSSLYRFSTDTFISPHSPACRSSRNVCIQQIRNGIQSVVFHIPRPDDGYKDLVFGISISV